LAGSFAEIVALPVPTAVTGMLADVAPAGTSRNAGTVATSGSLEESSTRSIPPAGALVERSIAPVVPRSSFWDSGITMYSSLRIVTVASAWTPPSQSVTTPVSSGSGTVSPLTLTTTSKLVWYCEIGGREGGMKSVSLVAVPLVSRNAYGTLPSGADSVGCK